MSQQKHPRRKAKMTDSELQTWMLGQCEEQPAPYPELEEPCRIWTRTTGWYGHGLVRYHKKYVRTHRLMFYLTHGRWPTDILCHKCDRPACLTLSHLFEGSQKENMADMVQKQRQAVGEENGSAKVDNATVLALRHEHAAGMSCRALARKYGVSNTLVLRIVTGQNWSHVGGPTRSRGKRGRRGADHPHAKLTAEQVREIRALAGQGLSQREIGELFGMSRGQIGEIVRRECWRHVD